MSDMYAVKGEASPARSPVLTENVSGPVANRETGSLLLAVGEVAQLLAISTRSVWRLDSAGKLPRAIPVGGLRRWRRQELVEWISAGCPDRSVWHWSHAVPAAARQLEGRE